MITPADFLRAKTLLNAIELVGWNTSKITTDMPSDKVDDSHKQFSRMGHKAGFAGACNFILSHPGGEPIRNLIRANIEINEN